MSDQDRYLLALHTVNGLGPLRLKKLNDYFGDFAKVWNGDPKEFEKVGIPKTVIENFIQVKKNLDPDDYLKKINLSGIKFKTIYDSDYPELLSEIYDPPIIFYYLGVLPKTINKSLAVVGTRKVTSYGRVITEKFVGNLAEAGLVIVSGLARGVDTIAHYQTLEVKGQTVAVLGGGFSLSNNPFYNIFPPENIQLAQKIVNINSGAILTEFVPNAPSLPGNFPSRNRIISGLSLATLVTEAAEDSGSLITAKVALDQGREVYAIPGPITSEFSSGTSLLIKQGGKLVTDPGEILEDLNIEKNPKNMIQFDAGNLSEVEKRVLNILGSEKHIDEIVRELNLKSAQVSATLIKMEIQGIVKNIGGGVYTKTI